MLKQFLSQHKHRCTVVAILWIIGVFLMFAVTGHDYIGLALIGVGALLVFYPLCRMPEQQHKAVLWLRRSVSAILALCVGYFCVVEAFILSDARTETHETADYIIVLGAGVNGTKLSLSLRDRLVGAYDYMTANPDTIAIVSGGQGEGELISEAMCMHNWLINRGIDPNRIIMEDKATCTLETTLKEKFTVGSWAESRSDSKLTPSISASRRRPATCRRSRPRPASCPATSEATIGTAWPCRASSRRTTTT